MAMAFGVFVIVVVSSVGYSGRLKGASTSEAMFLVLMSPFFSLTSGFVFGVVVRRALSARLIGIGELGRMKFARKMKKDPEKYWDRLRVDFGIDRDGTMLP